MPSQRAIRLAGGLAMDLLRTMLLCLSRPLLFSLFLGNRRVLDLLRDGHDRDGPLAVEGKLLSGHEVSRGDPGAAGRSFEGQYQGTAAD
jgi:hypothetical protein